MSLHYFEGFETNRLVYYRNTVDEDDDPQELPNWSSNANIQFIHRNNPLISNGVRESTGDVSMCAGYNGWLRYAFHDNAASSTQMIVGFAVRATDRKPGRDYGVRFLNASNRWSINIKCEDLGANMYEIELKDRDGTVQVIIPNASNIYSQTAWHYWEFEISMQSAGGFFKWWVDSIPLHTEGTTPGLWDPTTFVTAAGSETGFKEIYFPYSEACLMDDFYVIDVDGVEPNTRLGDIRIFPANIVTNASVSEWTYVGGYAGTADNYKNLTDVRSEPSATVGEIFPDQTSYIKATAGGQKHFFNFNNISTSGISTTAQVLGFKFDMILGKAEGTGDSSLDLHLSTDGGSTSTEIVSGINVPASGTEKISIFLPDNNGSTWTTASFNSMSLGFEANQLNV